MPLLHQALYELNFSVAPSCGIQIKVPISLRYFFNHPDSLVIHYRDSRLKDHIRNTVASVYHNAGVQLQRSLRAQSGFDFHFEHEGEEKGISHSQLISRIVAHHVGENRKGLMHYTPVQLAEWLKRSILEVSGWNINNVYAYITAHKLTW